MVWLTPLTPFPLLFETGRFSSSIASVVACSLPKMRSQSTLPPASTWKTTAWSFTTPFITARCRFKHHATLVLCLLPALFLHPTLFSAQCIWLTCVPWTVPFHGVFACDTHSLCCLACHPADFRHTRSGKGSTCTHGEWRRGKCGGKEQSAELVVTKVCTLVFASPSLFRSDTQTHRQTHRHTAVVYA